MHHGAQIPGALPIRDHAGAWILRSRMVRLVVDQPRATRVLGNLCRDDRGIERGHIQAIAGLDTAPDHRHEMRISQRFVGMRPIVVPVDSQYPDVGAWSRDHGMGRIRSRLANPFAPGRPMGEHDGQIARILGNRLLAGFGRRSRARLLWLTRCVIRQTSKAGAMDKRPSLRRFGHQRDPARRRQHARGCRGLQWRCEGWRWEGGVSGFAPVAPRRQAVGGLRTVTAAPRQPMPKGQLRPRQPFAIPHGGSSCYILLARLCSKSNTGFVSSVTFAADCRAACDACQRCGAAGDARGTTLFLSTARTRLWSSHHGPLWNDIALRCIISAQ